MQNFIIDWYNDDLQSGTLFTSVGLVLTYTNQDNIDDKVVNGKVYGFLEMHQVISLSKLLEQRQKIANTSKDYIAYLFYDDRIDEIAIDTQLINEIQTLQYEVVV